MFTWLVIAGAVLVGVLTAAQSRINGELGARLDNGMVAAAINMSIGTALIAVLTFVMPAGRRGVRSLFTSVRSHNTPWWLLIGGIAGALTIATQGLTVAVIGVSLFTVGIVAGQTLNGLILDQVGYGPGGVVPVTIPRILGAALALVAVMVPLQSGVLEQVPIWMLVLPFIAGVAIAWQQATNGRLRAQIGSPLTTTLVNFTGGMVLLVIPAAFNLALGGTMNELPSEPWLYLGGFIGVAYILLSVVIVAKTGVLLMGLCVVTGQLLTAFVIDIFWPSAAGLGWETELAMVGIALLSVLVATIVLPKRKKKPSSRVA